jgi:hypothetical protein
MSLDDQVIESNLSITIAKRNKAPKYASIEAELETLEDKISTLK